MLLDSLLAGGAERIAVETATALDPERYEATVVVTRATGPLEDVLDRRGVSWTALGRRRGFAPSKLRAAHRLLRDADLIYSHKFGSNIWGALFSRSTGVPLVVNEQTFSGIRTWRRTYGYRYWIAPTARRIICPTQHIADSLRTEGVPADRLLVIPNGVELDVAMPRAEAREALGLAPNAFVVGIVARLRPEKAHEVLLRAIARVNRTGRDATVCILGDGPTRARLEEEVAALDIGRSVVWAGERSDAKQLVSAFDVGVLCSNWEGLPVAVLETMAGGVPVVSTDVGSMRLLLGDDCGVLVPAGDDAALAEAIGGLFDDPERRRALGVRGHERIRSEYSIELMVERFQRVFDEVLGTG
jgi:glycosyltransferase involved in cell wall biosynthesis